MAETGEITVSPSLSSGTDFEHMFDLAPTSLWLEDFSALKQLFDAWRAGWTPGRIVVAGLLAGFLVGRGQPLAHIGGVRWLQMAGTVSSMLATLRAAAEAAATPADADAAQAGAGPQAAPDTIAAAAASPASSPVHAPAPAEAATELSER